MRNSGPDRSGRRRAAVVPTPERYQELARFKALSGACWNAPAISQGRIYARSIKEGVCLDVSVPQSPPLQLLAPALHPDGGLQFRLENQDGSALMPDRLDRLEVLGSTSLADWTAVSNAVVSPDATIRVPPADGAVPSRAFYRILDCPGLGGKFNRPDGWKVETDWEGFHHGYVIGYNYLGGHTRTPWPPLEGETSVWISPQNLGKDPNLVLVTDLNDWSPAESKTFAPHGRNGPVFRGLDFANSEQGGLSSAAGGAQGGSVGLVDGSVAWKSMRQMRVYSGSLKWGDGGCHAAW